MAESIYNFDVGRANGTHTTLAPYEGNVLLIVNVASECGFTPQYAGLEQLDQDYKDKGLRVLAFPSNDFGGQEPGTMEQIVQFCTSTYGVSFDLFQKVHAKGEYIHPLYDYLTNNATPNGDVQWNFEKFLISKDGRIIGRFPSNVAPQDPELIKAIEAAL